MKKKTVNEETRAQTFILDQPRDWTAERVVRAGKNVGIVFSRAYVYETRHNPKFKNRKPRPEEARKEAAMPPRQMPRPPPRPPEPVEPPPRDLGKALIELDLLVAIGGLTQADAWASLVKVRQHETIVADSTTNIELAEEERLLVLLALAGLANENPRFVEMASRIAGRLESQEGVAFEDALPMFVRFRAIRCTSKTKTILETRADGDGDWEPERHCETGEEAMKIANEHLPDGAVWRVVDPTTGKTIHGGRVNRPETTTKTIDARA